MGGKWYCSTAMPHTFYCAIIGRKDNDIFPITIDESKTVGELKHEIKQAAGTTGLAHTLKLCKVNINISTNEALERVMGKVSQNTTYTQELQALSTKPTHMLTNPSFKLSKHFKKRDVTIETIHILVELPPGESIDSIDLRVWCVAETSPISSAMPTADEGELIYPKASGAVCGH